MILYANKATVASLLDHAIVGLHTLSSKSKSANPYVSTKKLIDVERVERIVRDTVGKITKGKIMLRYPDLSQTTVAQALCTLVAANEIQRVGGRRYSGYVPESEKHNLFLKHQQPS
jgi:predicted phosphohydrolase